ncbi:ankyrin repeat-containing domain protein [Hypoxylon sp. FL0543]|nr:ankyrin repeat-containing domain protein [Hypoxylon sp. FL0543]
MNVFHQLSDVIVSLYTAVLRHIYSILHYYAGNWAVRFIKSVAAPKSDLEAKYSTIRRSRLEGSKMLIRPGVRKAILQSYGSTVFQRNQTTAQLLLEHGRQKEGVAVARSIRAGLVDSTMQLKKAGFDSTGSNFAERRTALHYASEAGSAKVIQSLLEAKAPANCTDCNGQTPLHLAAARGHRACAEMLLEHSSDILVKNENGKNPISLAEMRGHESTVNLVRRRSATTE